jgi:integrase
MESVPLDAAGHRRSPATMPGYHRAKTETVRAFTDRPHHLNDLLDRRRISRVVLALVMRWSAGGDRACAGFAGAFAGRRDHAIIPLAAQTGLRADELIKLDCGDIHLGTGAHVYCVGRGRKHRVTPLIPVTVATIKVWLAERAGGHTEPLFPTRQGRRLSHDALERRIAKHADTASRNCPSLSMKAGRLSSPLSDS